MDAQDGSLDGLTDLDAQDVADANRPYGEVTAEDLASDDLVADGADAAGLVTQDERLGVDAALHTDPPRTEETIDERLAQEVPDEGAEVADEVEDFPAFIVVDDKGNDFFAEVTKPVLLQVQKKS